MNIFLFRRDLRIYDNITLNEMSKNYNEKILPIFIFEESEWKSRNQLQFLIESLIELDNDIKKYGGKLMICKKNMLKKFINSNKINIIGWNQTYDNYFDFIKLENKLILEDSLLIPLNELEKKHAPFKKFTPYYKFCKTYFKISKPIHYNNFKFTKDENNNELQILKKKYLNYNDMVYVHGGYKNGIKMLNVAKNTLHKYGKTRNFLNESTSYLSAYLSLNVISIREVYDKMKNVSEDFIRELYWRDFYIMVGYYFANLLFKNSLKIPKKLDEDKKRIWNDWKKGTLNIPIVDACMTQLNSTGYMHNRGRMIVASYLIKDLKIPYQYGELHFCQQLIDYNLFSNNGGWQWVNGTGMDSQPSYQKFNMLIQNKKYDPECKYIKEWLPHLKEYTPKEIFEMYPK